MPGYGFPHHVIRRSADGKKAVTAYFIMGRSENSRNRVFVEDGEGIRTQAFDPSKRSFSSDNISIIFLLFVKNKVKKSLGNLFIH